MDYTFAGTASTGGNAFLVHSDYSLRIRSSFGSIMMFPPFVKEARDNDGASQFISGAKRAQIIAHQSEFGLKTGITPAISILSDFYSSQWIQGMPRTLLIKKL